jgi:hypothetical protein
MLNLFCALSFLLIAACGSADEAPPPQQEAQPQGLSSSSPPGENPLTGTWTGSWGPNERDRNDVTVELAWDGTSLTGTVNPGPNAIPLQQSRFNPATGEVHFEADAQGRGGQTIHYVVDGKVEGNTMSGMWNHPERGGDFTITRQ